LTAAVSEVSRLLRPGPASGHQRPPAGSPRGTTRSGTPRPRVVYPGDFIGSATIEYRPIANGCPDPGEVVWTWVPYEENHNQGKDRPVLVVGCDGEWLLALMLSSKDHVPSGSVDMHQGREWLDIGPGAWDKLGRPSEVRLDRVLRVAVATVRREGAQLSHPTFQLIATEMRTRYGWL
jgi:hypothetical protein